MFRKPYRFITVCFILTVLVACNSNNVPERNVVNENVTIENMDKIKLGDKETGEGGTSYFEVVKLFHKKPRNRAEIDGNPTKVEAQWYYDNKGFQSITVNFVDDKAVKKTQTGMD